MLFCVQPVASLTSHVEWWFSTERAAILFLGYNSKSDLVCCCDQYGRVFIILHFIQQFLAQIHNSMLVRQTRHNFMHVCHMVQSSTRICWQIPYHRLKCPACYLSALTSLNFSQNFLLYVTCEAIT